MAVAAPVKPASARKPGAAAAAPQAKARAGPTVATPFLGGLQAKLALGPVNDGYEREADRAAAHVLGNRPGAPTLSAVPTAPGAFNGIAGGAGVAQRACAACGGSEEDRMARRVQRKCACGAAPGEPCSCKEEKERKKEDHEHAELKIDRRAKRDGAARSADPLGAVQSVVRSPGRPLPDPVRAEMERGFGRSFGHVRVHDNARAAASAEAIGAHAYTVGDHIAFNRGQYRPGTEGGRYLLAHELAHTVQQSGAPPPRSSLISQPGDKHEAQANRAADAALGGAPMPALTPGAAPISRNGVGEFLLDAAPYVVLGPVGGYLLPDGSDIAEAAVDTAASVASAVWDFAVDVAEAIGGAVSLDGTTVVIDVPKFDPCPDIDFELSLSDIGLDPTLNFPIVAGAAGIGIVDVVGVLSILVNLDPGVGFKLTDCDFGPAQIRINPLSMSTSISGQLSVTGASMVSLGGDLGIAGDLFGVIAWPDPPIVLVVPLVGLELGGTYQLMLQSGGTITGRARASMGLGGVSAANVISGDVGTSVDLSYGLFGALTVLGQDLCRLGWPLDSHHAEAAASFTLATSISIGRSGLSLSFGLSASPLSKNPLDDLGFAFDDSRLEDDCWLCDFLSDLGLLPSQNGFNWADPAYQASLPRLGGPRRGVFKRDPGLTSGALCRGTCGINCPDGTCDDPEDLIICENVGDRHVWHTYHDYATCGAHPGCMDHDACYDMAADMPIWGFGGFMFGPMYRACDLDAVCRHSFKQAVIWATGGGPYASRLRYADRRTVTPGCLGPCPENVAEEGEPEEMRTCLTDRELWPGLPPVSQTWGRPFFDQRIFQGFVEVPYIVGVHYGVDATLRADAEASAQLGALNLENACLIYDPATMTYRGTADLSIFANIRGSARITGTLEGFLSDFLCLLNWVTLRGTLSAGITAQLPTTLTAGVDLFCANGDLHVLPRVALKPCLDIFGEVAAGIDVFLLSFNVWGQEWTIAEKQLFAKCWDMKLEFDPFIVGQVPNFDLDSTLLVLEALLGELFDEASPREIDRRPVSSPLPSPPRLLFPCLDGDDDDDDDDDDDTTAECPRKADRTDAIALLTPAQRQPRWGGTSTVSIPGGGSAGVGTFMEAEFLISGLPGGGRPSVQTAIYGHPGIPTEGCFRRGESKKDTQRFVRGHLLNENIGGPGNREENLFPITGQANADHKNRVEQGGEDVVGEVRGGALLYYKVTVTGASSPIEIMDSTGNGMGFYEIRATFLCEIADYQFCEDNTLRKNTPKFVPIPSRFVFAPPPPAKPFDQIVDPSRC